MWIQRLLFAMSEPLVLTRYADVARALRDPDLRCETPDGASHRQFRLDAMEAYSAARIAEWKTAAEAELDFVGPCADLVVDFAKPWALRLAAVVAPCPDVRRMDALAGDVFAAAAEPFDDGLKQRAAAATAEMASVFRNGLDIQAFVALSQTLPCFLGNAWLALLQHPGELARLRDDIALMPDAVEELLRYAGPSLAVLRRNSRGDVVVLRLGDANRDADEFPDPDQLDLSRAGLRHVAFGGGLHGCVGAALIRMASQVATESFVRRFGGVELVGFEECRGFGIRCTWALRVS